MTRETFIGYQIFFQKIYGRICTMNKIFVILLLASTMLFGCKMQVTDKIECTSSESRFVVVEQTVNWQIVYDKETLVMYSVSDGAYNYGTFTVLVNSDGKPLLWKGVAE
jgi:hypothetical protein